MTNDGQASEVGLAPEAGSGQPPEPGRSAGPGEPVETTARSLGARLGGLARSLVIPVLAIFSGLVIGALVIVLSDLEVVSLWTSDPGAAFGASIQDVANAYGALFAGSLGDPGKIVAAISSGDPEQMTRALRPISESLLSATPLIFTGLSVGLGFRSGLFNIGAEGQLYVGALFAVVAGFSFGGLPPVIHVPLAIAFGFLGGALWGFVPGLLKARTGAHEVIVTIMLNYVAYRFIDLALKNPPVQREGATNPISKFVLDSAAVPFIIPGLRVTWWFVLALVAAVVISWLLFKSTKGFEFRAVGLNPHAARYAGMNIALTTVLTMVIAGGLAGLAGASVMLVPQGKLTPGFSPGYGFDAIALALLGKSRPAGIVAAAILFGVLRAGATPMQAATAIPIDLVVVVQALVIMFIAAPALVRGIYRLRVPKGAQAEVFSKGWGS